MRNPARERSRNLNREVWESPSVYGGDGETSGVTVSIAGRAGGGRGEGSPIPTGEPIKADCCNLSSLSILSSRDLIDAI